MNFIQQLLLEITQTNIETIDLSMNHPWEASLKNYDDEKVIGKMELFELQLFVAWQNKTIQHEQTCREFFVKHGIEHTNSEINEDQFDRKMTDPAFLKEMQDFNITTQKLQKDQSMIEQLLWYHIGKRFPEKPTQALFIKESSAITFSKQAEVDYKEEQMDMMLFKDEIRIVTPLRHLTGKGGDA
jgi:hypothetical protein